MLFRSHLGSGFSKSPADVGVNLINHDRDWLYLTKDLGVSIPLWEYDSLSRKRISRLITLQEKRLEYENKIKEQQYREAERKAKAAQQTALHRSGGRSQKIPIN